MPILTFRCEDNLKQALERVSKVDKKSKTDVIREALVEYIENRTRKSGKSLSSTAGWEAYIGAVQGQDNHLPATNSTVRQVMEGILHEKERTGRL